MNNPLVRLALLWLLGLPLLGQCTKYITNPYTQRQDCTTSSGDITSGAAVTAQTYTAQTVITVTHNYGNVNYVVQCVDVSGNVIEGDVVRNANTAVITFNTAVSGSCVAVGGSLGGGGGATVSSVAATATGIFSFGGSPITSTGTLTLIQTGTSGGIPYFSNGTTLATSAELVANRIVLGGGAGAAPTVVGGLGTTTQVLFGNASGAPSFGDLPVGSTTVSGIAEAAINTEVDAGTDAARYITPDALAGSTIFGLHAEVLQVLGPAIALTTGDGKFYFRVPATINGMNLISVHGQVVTVSSSGAVTVQIAKCAQVATGNVCSGTVVDMLSTALTIDANEDDSGTAATAAVVNTSVDDMVTNQVVRVDIDGAGTGTLGLIITLNFQLP